VALGNAAWIVSKDSRAKMQHLLKVVPSYWLFLPWQTTSKETKMNGNVETQVFQDKSWQLQWAKFKCYLKVRQLYSVIKNCTKNLRVEG
jgi:hypothetical protein